MAITLFVVRATITKDKEAAFNTWYNEEHAPQVLQYNGAVSARRYRKILGEDSSSLRVRQRGYFPAVPGVRPPRDAGQGLQRQLRDDVGARALCLRADLAVTENGEW
jgi:hypothetical protein